MTRADIIRAELERIRDRVPAWLAAEGAPRGRFTARELDIACRRHGPCAPGSACRMLRAMRDELGVRYVDRARDFGRALKVAGLDVHLVAPWSTYTKAGIATWARERPDTWTEVLRSWSCYLGGDVPCGECGACVLRRHALDAARNAIPVMS